MHTPDAIFCRYDTAIAELGYAAREYLLRELPGIKEEVDIPANLLGYSYGPGYKNLICTLIASKKMMKIGLNRGAELPDPAGLLKGTGKVHKYVEVRAAEDLARPELKQLLAATVAAWKERSGK